MENITGTIKDSLRCGSGIPYQCAYYAGCWPRLSPKDLLGQLGARWKRQVNDQWVTAFVYYGLAFTSLQYAKRLVVAAASDDLVDLSKGLSNRPHDGWAPQTYPEWLLLEIESNIAIRRIQADIALEMIAPTSRKNSILQLNMGEGKSSVIVPMIAAVLADGTKLPRVIVLRQLSAQMFDLLLSRLGGLLDHPIMHFPINRSLCLDAEKVGYIENLLQRGLEERAVVLTQPEHILSFQLMGLEHLLTGRQHLGQQMVRTQRWLENNSRDVLDESDEILSVNYELIYTIGLQRSIDLSPDRWIIVQEILGLVARVSEEVQRQYPDGLLMAKVPSKTKPIRILQHDAGSALLEEVAKMVFQRGLSGISLQPFPAHLRDAMLRFTICMNPSDADLTVLSTRVWSNDHKRHVLLLLRGLFSGGVLDFVVRQRRWRVDYGHDLSRTLLAVPYRAKDRPAPRAEFSHPDATIALTCLTYYRTGLSHQQLKEAFDKLLLLGDASEEYCYWVRDATRQLSPSLQTITGVNLKDDSQFSNVLYPCLSYAKATIDFYLSKIVFPSEMKEFPQKLSSSGWNLAHPKAHPTTGFSGTNDSRYLLPCEMGQVEQEHLLHTNAQQIALVLRPENTFRRGPWNASRRPIDAAALLQEIVEFEPRVRIILDVGAQVLDLSNEEMARKWLDLPNVNAQAAIFFNEKDEISVLARDGTISLLRTSPFVEQIDLCIVYLDEAHTRGTNLRLPSYFRAAAILGPGVDKDRLVQAAMRMRKLGDGQSLVFFAPFEVEEAILASCGESAGEPIHVADIMKWTMDETWLRSQRNISLWAIQGRRYHRQSSAQPFLDDFGSAKKLESIADYLLEVEGLSIDERYALKLPKQGLFRQAAENPLVGEFLGLVERKFREFGVESLHGATLKEMQERELSPEIEQQTEVEWPPSVPPRRHKIGQGVRNLVQQGILDRGSPDFIPAFASLTQTRADAHFEKNAWPKDLLVTEDFARVVDGPGDRTFFLRPVRWLVSCQLANHTEYVIMSSYEVNELIPLIGREQRVILHVYSPRVSASSQVLERLTFCALPVPPAGQPSLLLMTSLNLFAGQLYLASHESYIALCRFLGICFSPAANGVDIDSSGFIQPENRSKYDAVLSSVCTFNVSPIAFLRALVHIRRRGQAIERSHLGLIRVFNHCHRNARRENFIQRSTILASYSLMIVFTYSHQSTNSMS